MAITPESLNSLSTAELAVITKAETIIDAELREKFIQNNPVPIRYGIIDFVFDENERVVDQLIENYEDQGWVITKYESKDGRWLNFAV